MTIFIRYVWKESQESLQTESVIFTNKEGYDTGYGATCSKSTPPTVFIITRYLMYRSRTTHTLKVFSCGIIFVYCVMERKRLSFAAKIFIIVWIIFVSEFKGVPAETCDKIDDCSCRKSNGKVITLRKIDRSSGGPA